jgi:hypothetical protein
VHISNVDGLVVIAAFMAAFGGIVYWRESRRGNRQQAIRFVIGIPGVYLCACAALERVGWLYIPGLTLIAASYVGQFLVLRRSRRIAAKYSNGADDQ